MSLLLDALKKAAEEKLANKHRDEDGVTSVDVTDMEQATVSPSEELAESASVDLPDEGLDYDATMVDHTGMPPVDTAIDASEAHEDLTSFDIEPVEPPAEEVKFSDTEVGHTKTQKEATELENDTDLYGQQYRYDMEKTVIGAETEIDANAIDIDETGIDITQINQSSKTQGYSEPTQSKTSLTDNFVQQGYQNSPQAASQVIGMSQPSQSNSGSKWRIFALLGLALLVGLFILVMFGYQYYTDTNAVNYKLSYEQYKIKRKDKSAIEAAKDKAADNSKDEIVVQQKDYVSLLDKQFDEVEAQASTLPKQASVNTKPKVRSKKAAPQPQRIRAIKIKKRQEAPVLAAVQQGYDAFNDGDLESAKQFYGQALEVEPENRDVLLGVAAIAITENDSSTARQIYAQLLEDNPADPDALAGLTALGPVAKTNTDQASVSSVKQMLEQQPEAAHLHFALGNLYADQSRWAEAQKAFFEAYRLDASNPDYLYNLAVSLDYMGKPNTAINFYQQAVLQSGIRQSNIPVAAAEERIKTIQDQASQ